MRLNLSVADHGKIDGAALDICETLSLVITTHREPMQRKFKLNPRHLNVAISRAAIAIAAASLAGALDLSKDGSDTIREDLDEILLTWIEGRGKIRPAA